MTSDIQFIATLSVSLSRVVDSGNWPAATQGADQIQARLAGVDLTVWNQAYIGKIPLAASGVVTIDLKNFDSLIFETALALNKVFAFAVQMAPADQDNTDVALTVAPGAANGFDAMFTGDNNIRINETWMRVCAPEDITGFTVDATHKTISFTNAGSDDLVATVIILGGN